MLEKNGQYIADFGVFFTINLRYEIRQDLIIKPTLAIDQFKLLKWRTKEGVTK